MYFLGAGQCNAVFALPPSFLSTFSSSRELGTQWIVGRIARGEPPPPCIVCLTALKHFVGGFREITLDSCQAEKLIQCITALGDHQLPFKKELLLKLETKSPAPVMRLIPNFAADPGDLFVAFHSPSGVRGITTAELLVELKPKCAWRSPRVVGLDIEGRGNVYLHPGKQYCCRFSMMQCLKMRKSGIEVRSLYCPNLLFRPELSSADGLRHLCRHPQNNLRVRRYGESALDDDTPLLTEVEITAVAAALDGSGLMPALEQLQVNGVEGREKAEDLMVLDIELLYPWFQHASAGGSGVHWLVASGEDVRHCRCQAEFGGERHLLPEGGGWPTLSRIAPRCSLEECIERFYTATTARDVSVMVSCSPPRSLSADALPSGVFLNKVGGYFSRGDNDPEGRVFRVGVVDLDDKRGKSLEHYYFRDQDCIRAWVQLNPDKVQLPGDERRV